MKECCAGQTTPWCGQCGTDLRPYSLDGLKAHLEKQLSGAAKTLKKWSDKPHTTSDGEKKVKQGIARNLHNVEKLQSWRGLIANILAETYIPDDPETT